MLLFKTPECINIEIVRGCNLDCVMCLTNSYTQSRELMPVELYRDTLKQICDLKISRIRFCGDGEPMIHRNLARYIQIAHEIGIDEVELITNGTLLTKQKISELYDSRLNVLIVSLDAINNVTYQQIRGKRFDLSVIENNLQELLFLRDQNKWELQLQVNFVLQELNKHEEAGFIKKWAPVADKTNIIKQRYFSKEPTKDKSLCDFLKRKLYISVHGDVFPCFFMHTPIKSLGNIQTNNIREMWESRIKLSFNEPDRLATAMCLNCNH